MGTPTGLTRVGMRMGVNHIPIGLPNLRRRIRINSGLGRRMVEMPGGVGVSGSIRPCITVRIMA